MSLCETFPVPISTLGPSAMPKPDLVPLALPGFNGQVEAPEMAAARRSRVRMAISRLARRRRAETKVRGKAKQAARAKEATPATSPLAPAPSPAIRTGYLSRAEVEAQRQRLAAENAERKLKEEIRALLAVERERPPAERTGVLRSPLPRPKPPII
jgi:hypothetical protein